MEIVESIVRITQPNSPLMIPAQHYLRQMSARASAFLIEVKPGAKAYRYDVSIKMKWYELASAQEYDKDLAKGTDEGLRSRNRNLCYEFLVDAYKRNQQHIPGEIIYDCKSTLYTSQPISPAILGQEIIIPAEECADYIKIYSPIGSVAHITIKANATGHELALDNFEQYSNRTTIHQEDRSIRTFMEMAVAQFGLNEYNYTPIGAGKLFEQQAANLPLVDNGMVLRSGIAKGVRIVQGENGNPTPALVVDTKVSPFFIEQEVTDLVRAIGGQRGFPTGQQGRAWDEIKVLLQHIRVEVTYARSRTFSIAGIEPRTAQQIQVQYNGQMVPLDEYFRQAHGYTIERPDLPLIIPHYANLPADSLKPDSYFPMEVLVVMPDQRVPLEKMSQRLSQRLLQANTLLPEQRYEQVMRHCDRLGIFNTDNSVLRAFGLRILRDSNKCEINVRQAPQIEFGDGPPLSVNPQKADWRPSGKKYYNADEIENWVILCHRQHEGQIRDFRLRFMREARARGMNFASEPRIQTFADVARWDATFEEFAQSNVQFVILIDPKSQDTHGILKYYEAIHKILTQHITTERVADCLGHQRGRQTLENILNKTNMKYSGLNYRPKFENSLSRFKLENNNVLVVGYDVACPPPMHPSERRMCQAVRKDLLSFDPSVVGITANMAVDPHNFVGDYFFQEAYREGFNYNKLRARFTWVLQVLNNFREGARPQYIFVIRNGISEGQFAEMVQRELQALKNGCKDFDADYHPNFVYVLGTKRHFKKFYADDNNRIQNMVPGSVVDHKFVRADCPEFFMQSHYALKGVGKPVEYNVLVDEIGCTKDEIEGFLNSLCYSHQIVNSAVSLPEPVFQADELAKRGRNNYITMKRLEESRIPRTGPNNFVDVDALDEILSYKDNPIFIGTRFTA